MTEFSPGDVFVGHRIEGLAGRGGMGVVYRATQLDLDRLVALKVITPALAQEPEFRTRFVAESKAAASIEHPNVLPVYNAGEREGVLFIVMRYVDGADLRTLVRASGQLDPARAAHVVAQVAAALDAAHAHGLVHRDVKPANILLGADDHAYLTDFGLTKRLDTSVDLSRSGSWVGTLGFVAPEQIRGHRVDARADVYALGCVLVHALTGSPPFMRESDEATLWAHLNAPPPTDAVPPAFADVVDRALAKQPSDRYPSAGDLARAALSAAGRSDAAAPERIVARGAAAPAEATRPTQRARADEETHPSPPRREEQTTPVTPAPRGSRNRPGRRWFVVAGAVGAIAAVAVVLLLGGDDDGRGGGAASEPPRLLRADPAIPTVTRPNSLAFSRANLAVLSARSGDVAFADAATGAPRRRVRVGSGANDIAFGFGKLWVAKFRTRSVLRIDGATLDRAGGAIALPTAGRPYAIATGEGAVWVGTHEESGIDKIIRISPRGAIARTISVGGGIHDLAVGDGAVWATNRSRGEVVRISVRDGAQRRIRVGPVPLGLTVGGGAVWVASAGNDSVTRIDTRTLRTDTIELTVTPTQVAFGGGSVWVTARAAASLLRIDPRAQQVREAIKTGHGPFDVGVYRGRSVWFTVVEEDAIQRVRLRE